MYCMQSVCYKEYKSGDFILQNFENYENYRSSFLI